MKHKILFILLIMSIVFYSCNDKTLTNNNKKVAIGDIWIKSYNKDNPFQKVLYESRKVLDVKDDYVLYEIINESDDNYNFLLNSKKSESIYFFTFNADKQ